MSCCAVGGAEQVISSWLQICSRSVGRWEEQHPLGQVAVEFHLVCAHSGAWLQGRMERLLPRNSTRLQDWWGCGSHPTSVYPNHQKPVPSTEHFIAKGVWTNVSSINVLLVLAVLEQILPWLPTDFTPFPCLKIHTGKRPEAPHPQEAVSCNQPWKTIYQSPSFIRSRLTKLVHALTLPVVQVCSQQRRRTQGTENGCCDTILKKRLKITQWICRKSCVVQASFWGLFFPLFFLV